MTAPKTLPKLQKPLGKAPTASLAAKNTRAQPQLQHQMTVDALGKAMLDLLQQVGGVPGLAGGQSATKGALLSCDLLRKLDSHPEQCPEWLQKADQRAVRELVRWFDARGFLQPENEADPGEPTNGQDAVETLLALPRPEAQTPVARLVEYLKCRRSVVYFIDTYCMLEDENRGIIPFRLWRWQAWMLCRWQQHSLTINLKARQIGVSECACGTALWLTLFHDTKNVILISKSEDDAQALLGRIRLMAEYLPDWLQPGADGRLNPAGVHATQIAKSNTQEYTLNHADTRGRPHYSAIISMAATKGAGRSRTAALVILDEMAHMIWGGDIWDSVKYTAGRGKIICISTALGMNNVYHRLWVGATSEDRHNGFYPIFLGWNRHPERDQRWYDQQKAEAEANNELPKLHQECPADPTEAFIQSGLPVFDQAYLTQHATRIREEMAIRKGEGLPEWTMVDGLTIYEEPIPGHQYVIGADTAGGGTNGDYDDASVVDRQTGYEVACLHGRWPAEVFAAKLDELGHRYNYALLAVERNNTYGGAVLADLLSGNAHGPHSEGKQVAYAHLYHYKSDLVPGQRQDARPGWETNLRTKPMMLKSMQQALREHAYHPRTLTFLDEALVFAYDESGTKTGAPSGLHDDMVISRCICVHLLLQPDYVVHALTFVQQMQQAASARVRTQRATAANTTASNPTTASQHGRAPQTLPARRLSSLPTVLPRVAAVPPVAPAPVPAAVD